MILIIGGAFQGKADFAKELLQTDKPVISGEACEFDDIFTAGIILDFHVFVKRFLEMQEFSSLPAQLSEKNPNLILVLNEIGYGIVPIEKTERLWREQTGRLCCQLVPFCEEVYRIVAGIPCKLKG